MPPSFDGLCRWPGPSLAPSVASHPLAPSCTCLTVVSSFYLILSCAHPSHTPVSHRCESLPRHPRLYAHPLAAMCIPLCPKRLRCSLAHIITSSHGLPHPLHSLHPLHSPLPHVFAIHLHTSSHSLPRPLHSLLPHVFAAYVPSRLFTIHSRTSSHHHTTRRALSTPHSLTYSHAPLCLRVRTISPLAPSLPVHGWLGLAGLCFFGEVGGGGWELAPEHNGRVGCK